MQEINIMKYWQDVFSQYDVDAFVKYAESK